VSAPASAEDDVLRFLSFSIGVERCAVELTRVQEIARCESATRVPRVPPAVLGVVNLRGTVLPVVDAAIGLGLPPAARTDQRCLLVVEPVIAAERTVLGLVADAVDGVLEVPPNELGTVPATGTRVPPGLLIGLIRQEGGFVSVLDLDRLFGAGLLRELRGAGDGAPVPAKE
jgi:purine-binding chemotaxis protein CheW